MGELFSVFSLSSAGQWFDGAGIGEGLEFVNALDG